MKLLRAINGNPDSYSYSCLCERSLTLACAGLFEPKGSGLGQTSDKHASAVARSCNYHAQAIRHIRHNACMQSDSIRDRLLQRCAPRRSIRHHPQAAASTEQRRKDCSSNAKTITRISTAEETTLVAGGAAHLLQPGLADDQNTTDVSTGVPQTTHQSTQWNSVTEIIGRALQTDCHRQTIVQLRCTNNLKLSACFCH